MDLLCTFLGSREVFVCAKRMFYAFPAFFLYITYCVYSYQIFFVPTLPPPTIIKTKRKQMREKIKVRSGVRIRSGCRHRCSVVVCHALIIKYQYQYVPMRCQTPIDADCRSALGSAARTLIESTSISTSSSTSSTIRSNTPAINTCSRWPTRRSLICTQVCVPSSYTWK